jgi:prepilin-type N-terminal cleavage/methylation domain-containing protein
MKPPRSGLTLMELVLVVGIIAILLSITWAGLSAFREKGRQAVCMSNLKQIGVALALYIHDYNGVAPALGARLKYWELGLPPALIYLHPHYIKDFRVLLCPTRFADPDWDPIKDTYKHLPADIKRPSYLKYYWTDNAVCRHGPEGCGPIPCAPYAIPFDEVIACCPDWPVVRCWMHGIYYGKFSGAPDCPHLGLFIGSWKVKWYTQAELDACYSRGRAILEGWIRR